MLAFLSVLFLAYHLPVNVKAELDLLDPTERSILIQFYNGTVGTDRWKQGCDAGWATYDADTCSWQGITCNAEGTHVTSINIGACNLVGTIPSTPVIPSIFGLKFVEQIFLSPGPDQFLSGNLPDDFNNQTPVLKQIQLTGHKLGGRLPPSLYKATSIQRIDLHSNQLQGSVSCLPRPTRWTAQFLGPSPNLTSLSRWGLRRTPSQGTLSLSRILKTSPSCS